VISAIILSRDERFQVRNFAAWVWWIIGAAAVAFVFQGAAQLWGLASGATAPVGFARASGLIFLPLYVLLAHAVTTLFRVARGHRALARWGCAFFAAAWMAPSDTLRVPRLALMDTVTMFIRVEEKKPHAVQAHHKEYNQWRELSAIARWMDANSPPGALLVFDSAELRLRSRRGVLACRTDVDWLYRCLPGAMPAWGLTLERQQKALRDGTRASLETLAADPAAREGFLAATPWYVVLLPSDAAAHDLPEVPPQGWGRYYVLCRLHGGSPTTVPATAPATAPSK